MANHTAGKTALLLSERCLDLRSPTGSVSGLSSMVVTSHMWLQSPANVAAEAEELKASFYLT